MHINLFLDNPANKPASEPGFSSGSTGLHAMRHFGGFLFIFLKTSGNVRAVRTTFPITAVMPAFTATLYGTNFFHTDHTFSGTEALMGLTDKVL